MPKQHISNLALGGRAPGSALRAAVLKGALSRGRRETFRLRFTFEGSPFLRSPRDAGNNNLFATGDRCWDVTNFLKPAGSIVSVGQGVSFYRQRESGDRLMVEGLFSTLREAL